MANTRKITSTITKGFNSFTLGAGGVGTTRFVSSIIGSSAYDGLDSMHPKATLVQALAASVAGDTIVLLPLHVETLIGAAQLACALEGVSVVGIGTGRHRPIINYTTSVAASFDVSGANFYIENVVFTPNGIDAITAAMNVTGSDFWMHNCCWDICNAAADKQMVLGILTAATATRFKVTDTPFIGPATVTGTTCTACIKHEVGVNFRIENCDFHGKMTQGILNATTILGGRIHNNRFQIYTGTKGISLAAATTAFITNNRFNVPSGTAPIVAAAGFVAGNIYSAAAGVTAGTASTF